MKRALFVATYGDFFCSFLLDKMAILQSLGYEIVCASNFENASYNKKTEELKKRNIQTLHIPFERQPFRFSNLLAYRRLKKFLKNEKFDLLDCHNPVAGAIARIATKKKNVSTVIYTAHGFFFFKGASLKARLLYQPIEKWLARKTDILITMSKEDFHSAQKMRVRNRVELVHGMGVDLERIEKITPNRAQKRVELGVKDEFLVACVGECIARKNQKTAIGAFSSPFLENAKLLVVGEGAKLPDLKKLARAQGVEERVLFLGYRADVLEILKSADAFLFPSYQEGLSIAVVEAMASKLPIVCSDIRGNCDCVDEGKGGFLFPPEDAQGMARALSVLRENPSIGRDFGEYNGKKAKEFSKRSVKSEYEKIYRSIEYGE